MKIGEYTGLNEAVEDVLADVGGGGGGSNYKGEWNASTNTPVLANGSGTSGNYYQVSVAGSVDFGSGSISFEQYDHVAYSGAIWYKLDNSWRASEILTDGTFTPSTTQMSSNVSVKTNLERAAGRIDTKASSVNNIASVSGDVQIDGDDIPNGSINRWLRESTNLQEKTSSVINNLGSYEIRPTLGDADSGVKYTHLNNSLKATLDAKLSPLNNKVYYVSETGNDSNIGYDITKPFLTLGAALTAAGNTGNQICVLPGTYAGNYTINQLNVVITALNAGPAGIVNFTGTVTVASASSNVIIQGLTMQNLIHSDAGTLYLLNTTVNTSTTLSGSGYVEAESCDFQGTSLNGTISITGAGSKIFQGGNYIGATTINNADVAVYFLNNIKSSPVVVTAGIFRLTNTPVYAITNGGIAVAINGGTFVANNAIVLNPNESIGKITIAIGCAYTFSNFKYDGTGVSPSAINIVGVSFFDALNAVNLTEARLLVSDASKRIVSSTATATEAGFLSGVTSSIQTQLNARAPLASPTFTGTVTIPTPVAATAAATKGYVDGLVTKRYMYAGLNTPYQFPNTTQNQDIFNFVQLNANGITVSSSTFTVPAGTYQISASLCIYASVSPATTSILVMATIVNASTNVALSPNFTISAATPAYTGWVQSIVPSATMIITFASSTNIKMRTTQVLTSAGVPVISFGNPSNGGTVLSIVQI